MTIEWFGEGCFKITGIGGHFSILTELPSRDSGLTAPRFKTDILLNIWSDLTDTLFSRENNERFVISGPGEYEVKEVFIRGIALSSEKGLIKTAYWILMENIKLAYLGEIAKKEIKPEVVDFFGGVDILLVPVGGQGMLDSESAVGFINQIEPKVVIPMYYKIPKLKRRAGGLEEFLKEMGSKAQAEEKLLIKAKDLNFKEMKIIPLKTI